MDLTGLIGGMSPAQRILGIIVLALVASAFIKLIRRFSEWVLTPRGTSIEAFLGRSPKLVTLTTLIVSALTFVVAFGALGLILRELGVSLTAYFASASVIGLAVAFGSQGLVQDVVTGLTLIFSNALAVGDVVDISGQSGRVEAIGLRFTTLVNLLDQRVYIPNRSINQINRYRDGAIRAYVDVQLPEGDTEVGVRGTIESIATAMRAQHGAIILSEPSVLGVFSASPGGWRYLRIEFRLWPGQGALIETRFVQRVIAAMRRSEQDYPDWKVSVTYRAAG